MLKSLTFDELWYGYHKPALLQKLEVLNQSGHFDTQTLGFTLDYSIHYTRQPLDIVPFARTGGDGGYFGFLSDFGYWQDLDQAPIVYVVAIDFWDEHPSFGVKIIAENLFDFLRVMATTYTAEIFRTYDVFSIDYPTVIAQTHTDLESINHDLRLLTLQRLQEGFDITSMHGLHDYYEVIYQKRASHPGFTPLRDQLGLLTDQPITASDKANYEALISNANLLEVLPQLNHNGHRMFLREYPFLKAGQSHAVMLERCCAVMAESLSAREYRVLQFNAAYELQWEADQKARQSGT